MLPLFDCGSLTNMSRYKQTVCVCVYGGWGGWGVWGERARQRNRQRERATLSEGDIPVAGCGFIVKVSELQSNKSHHLTPPSLTACSLPAARPSLSPTASIRRLAGGTWTEFDQ